MGCNCGGSTQQQQGTRRGRERTQAEQREPRQGGPGEAGYYFTGPPRPPTETPAPANR